ncbi:hypothetical protein [Arenimonas sp.]|uniref:hypothetical protein n=1 Tax=Arenimonas sp. TaxID=1872635 RepID=UPI001E5E795C
MIRKLLLAPLLFPAFAFAAGAPCEVPSLAPLPDTVPAPEMLRAPAAASCLRVDALSFVERLRKPATPAPAAPASARPAAATASNSGYVPKTAHDNTPWRFDMNQNGRRMTAEEFDAWMKAKGIRVATGKPAAAADAPAPAAAAPATAKPGCQASATQAC